MEPRKWVVTYADDSETITIFDAHAAADAERTDELIEQAQAWGRNHHLIDADDEECARLHTLGDWADGQIGNGSLTARIQAAQTAREHAWYRHPHRSHP